MRWVFLQADIESLFGAAPETYSTLDRSLFAEFLVALNRGEIRSAEPDAATPTGWRVNTWVKKGILLGFRMGSIVDMSIDHTKQPFFDKSTYHVKQIHMHDGVRLVPGGSSVRDGVYLGNGVTCMPPMYINVGAYVGDGTMVDSHALVGSCAQIGRNVHLSAAAQIGGVLEPVGALPVIVEDGVMVGGNCGIYEGTVLKTGVVLGTGTILNRSTPIYDLVTGEVHSATGDEPLIVPANAVVVPGARAITQGLGKDWGLSLYTPVIVKYRDDKTGAKVQLEELLR